MRARKPPPTIRSRLVALVLAIVIPCAAISAVGAVLLWGSAQSATDADLLYRAQALSSLMVKEIETAKATLRALATSPVLDSGDIAAFHRQLQGTTHALGTRIVLSDTSGKMLANSLVPYGTELRRRADSDIVRKVYETAEAQVSDLYTVSSSKEFLIAVDVPVIREGRVIYELSMGFRPDTLQRVMAMPGADDKGRISAILDGKGAIIARNPSIGSYLGRKASEEARAANANPEAQGMFSSPSVDGTPVRAAFSRLPGTSWIAVSAIRKVAVNASLWRSLAVVAAGGAALLMLGLGVALFQARSISASIRALASLHPDFGSHGVREVSEVARTLEEARDERGIAEAALRESEASMLRVLDSMGEGFALLGTDFRVIRVNAEALRLSGRPREDIVGRPLLEAWPEVAGTPMEAACARAMAERTSADIVHRQTSAGREQWLDVRAYPTPDGLALFYRDATDRLRAREALQESEVRFRTLADAMPQMVWSSLPDGSHDYYNARWFDFTGLVEGRKDDEGLHRILHPEDRSRAMGRWHECLKTGEPYEAEYRLRAADGSYRWALARALPVRDATTGRVIRWFGTCTDIEDTVAAREALARYREDLERLVAERTRDLEATQARLVQAQRMEALGQLAGGVAHDFNNVLQAVQGGGALIERRPEDVASVRRFARMIIEASERGASVTRRLLAFSRRGDLRAEAVDAGALLESMREILVLTLGSGVEIHVKTAPGMRPLMADKGQLETVLVNLATNARDAMSGTGVLTLAADVADAEAGRPLPLDSGAYVRISVTDTGSGMDPATLARASEPFFTTKTLGKGTGLGLAMARGFAEQSGGGLNIESKPGRGTTVSLWLPAAGKSHTTSGAVRHATVPSAKEAARILMVDDDPIVLETLAAEMREAGHTVEDAPSGAAALALLDCTGKVDLLVSDLSMPGMDGMAVIREAQRRRPELPAILLTGFATNAAELALGGSINGTFSLLRKPVDAGALAERIAVMLEAAKVRM